MKKLVGILAVMLSFSLAIPTAAKTDLEKNHPFYEEIDYLMEKEVIRGYPDGTIRPDEVVTRAEATAMIGRLKGLDNTQRATPFQDVPAGHYASGYIAESAEAEYIVGYSDGTFRPNKSIIRGDMALIVERVFDLAFGYPSFTDVPEDAYYSGAVSKMAAANITIGYPDKTFRPRTDVTRGQFAAFLARAMEPEFKNDAVIQNSYLKDKTKEYTYLLADGTTATHSYVDVPDRDGLPLGFMWTVDGGGVDHEYLEIENHDVLVNLYPYSEGDTLLAYPVQLGKTFESYASGEIRVHTITGLNMTIETAYKTFTDVTEVTTPEGNKYYLAEGFSIVKNVNAAGEVSRELLSVE